jgi:hypothetical protein
VLKERQKSPDLGQPRSVAEVLATALGLYARYPLLFLGLAMAVVVPYELVVLVVAKASPLGQENASTGTILTLALVDFALVGPLVSSLQVRAVMMLGEHERPSFLVVIRRSLRVLPVVMAAEIIAGLGIAGGLVLFVIPGVILALRWAVVAQVAAVEQTDWPGALRRSWALTTGNWLRVLVLLLCVSLVNVTLTRLGAAVIGTRTRPAEVVAGIAIAVVESSFQALTLAVLYFDLRARENRL